MAQPSYLPTSIAELARLSDEIWFLAGDTSVDTSWYTKRASLSMIYSSTGETLTPIARSLGNTDVRTSRAIYDARQIDRFCRYTKVPGPEIGRCPCCWERNLKSRKISGFHRALLHQCFKIEGRQGMITSTDGTLCIIYVT